MREYWGRGSSPLLACRFFLLRSYPKVRKHTINQPMDSLLDANDTMAGRMVLFEDRRNELKEKLETALNKKRHLLDGMVRLLAGVEVWMLTLEDLAGGSPRVRALGSDLPREPAPEALRRRVKTLTTVMEDMRPLVSLTKSIPYGRPQSRSASVHTRLFGKRDVWGEDAGKRLLVWYAQV